MAYVVIFEVNDVVNGSFEKQHILDSVPSVDDVVMIDERDFDGHSIGSPKFFRVLLRTFNYAEYLRPGDERDMMSLECVRVLLTRDV